MATAVMMKMVKHYDKFFVDDDNFAVVDETSEGRMVLAAKELQYGLGLLSSLPL